jgi:neurotransmitter:Na+ symporter, NSS family
MAERSERWSGRVGFILATIGSAVGLGSVWKFPYEVGTNGGSAFVLLYLLGLVLIVMPLMLAEFAIGRHGRSDAAESLRKVAYANAASPRWSGVGALGAFVAFLILSFYAVIGGWTIAYAVETVVVGLPAADPAAAQARYDALLSSPGTMMACHAAFMTLTGLIVARGISHGIEAACKVLMPILVVLMVLLAGYSLATGDVAATLRFLFAFDLANVSPVVALSAIGLGFFSIGVGMAVLITYAAYAGAEIDLRQAAMAAVVADTAISFLAGFAVFPVVFANALDPAAGPGLLFVTLPLAFARMPLGTLAAVAFFLLLLVAALSSAISLLEMVVAPLKRTLGWPRPLATLIAATTVSVLGLASVLSFNLWRDWYPLGDIPMFASATWYDLLDHVTSNLLLPIGGFALAIFTGWVLPERLLRQELKLGRSGAALLRALLRYVVPAGIAAVTVAPFLA